MEIACLPTFVFRMCVIVLRILLWINCTPLVLRGNLGSTVSDISCVCMPVIAFLLHGYRCCRTEPRYTVSSSALHCCNQMYIILGSVNTCVCTFTLLTGCGFPMLSQSPTKRCTPHRSPKSSADQSAISTMTLAMRVVLTNVQRARVTIMCSE